MKIFSLSFISSTGQETDVLGSSEKKAVKGTHKSKYRKYDILLDGYIMISPV